MNGTIHSKPRVWLLLCALTALAGCATAAQRQAQQAALGTREAAAQLKACSAAVIHKPEYVSLLLHTPDLETGQPMLAQLTDESMISSEDAKLFGARHDELNPCKSRLLNVLSTVRPDLVPILSDEYTKGTAIAVQLVERKITWGEFAQQGQVLLNDSRQRIAVADRQWISDLNASHQAEMAQRQAAAAALMQWSAQQQMINAMNRPVIVAPAAPIQTTCNRMGNFVNCTSQ